MGHRHLKGLHGLMANLQQRMVGRAFISSSQTLGPSELHPVKFSRKTPPDKGQAPFEQDRFSMFASKSFKHSRNGLFNITHNHIFTRFASNLLSAIGPSGPDSRTLLSQSPSSSEVVQAKSPFAYSSNFTRLYAICRRQQPSSDILELEIPLH